MGNRFLKFLSQLNITLEQPVAAMMIHHHHHHQQHHHQQQQLHQPPPNVVQQQQQQQQQDLYLDPGPGLSAYPAKIQVRNHAFPQTFKSYKLHIFIFSNSQHSEIESFQLQTQSVDLSPMKLAQNQLNGGGGGGGGGGGVPIGSQRLRQV